MLKAATALAERGEEPPGVRMNMSYDRVDSDTIEVPAGARWQELASMGTIRPAKRSRQRKGATLAS
jgi:hypothetical protein